MQDEFAVASQSKAEAAIKAGKFKDEIVPVVIHGKKGDTVFDTDEHPKFGTTLEKVAKLKPAFKRDGGTVTAANASGINDSAAALVVMSKEKADELGIKPLATIVSYATGGVDPSIMGVGPVPAVTKALARANMTVDDLDLIEANEAFAAQSLAVAQDLKFDMSKVNVNGGAIALGHPIGASGARIHCCCQKSRSANDLAVRVSLDCLNKLLSRNVNTEVDNFEASRLDHHANEVLADIMKVTSNSAEDELTHGAHSVAGEARHLQTQY